MILHCENTGGNMFQSFLIKYGEIAIKGKNRYIFEDALVAGLKHALKPASEAGVDLSNAPGTYVSLLPDNPENVAKELKKRIEKEVCVIIIDTDATYMKNGKYFTGLPIAIDGIDADNGFFGYVKGQLSKNMGSTPLGCSEKIDVETALKIANIAEDYQKSLSTEMKTIHSVKDILGTEFDEVTIEDLDSIIHTPAVIIRPI